ncbi:uncharacterized protein LOC128278229 [Anopheles cruzii]|uniref:uncharacterized protein LOC128278229 n=1 Tax=Anopheles cruzii TaxID=68878 RepID=UPI0022EC6253|nr:uncharacterized protein LOC128278229 [Anopheles cruzii]
MASHVRSFSAVLLVALFVLSVVHVSRQASISLQVLSRAERSVVNETFDMIDKKCESNSPCGWAIYTPYTRKIEKFVQNTCECPKTQVCIRTDDDISTSTFVYRCREGDKKSTPES